MSKPEFKFKNTDGKAIGAQGYEVDHKTASNLAFTGLYRGREIVALLVAKGGHESLSEKLTTNGQFIVTACNTHAPMVAALKIAAEALKWSSADATSPEAKQRHTAAQKAVAEALTSVAG